MKQILSLFTFLAIGQMAYSQAPITTTSGIGYAMPVQIASAATGATVPIGTVGTGVTWDCSNLVQEAGTPTINFTVISPAGTPYVSDYPSANWTFYDPALIAQIGYAYHKLTVDSFVLYGARKASSSYEIYDDPELELVMPLAYNQTVNNSYSKTNYNANGSVSSYQTGDITLTYDGFGTLILPGGTYTSVAKVKSVRTNSLGATTTSYMWYNTVDGERILNYDGVSSNQVTYRSGAPLSVSNVNQIEKMTCGVNASRVYLESESLMKNIEVRSITGQLVYSLQNPNQKIISFDLQNLAASMYIVSVKTENMSHSFKVLVQ